jgi:hypothetical protein
VACHARVGRHDLTRFVPFCANLRVRQEPCPSGCGWIGMEYRGVTYHITRIATGWRWVVFLVKDQRRIGGREASRKEAARKAERAIDAFLANREGRRS